MFVASIPSDPITLLLALFTLFGLPLIIFSIVLFYAGYVRYDADKALDELDAEAADPSEQPDLSEPGKPVDPSEPDATEPNADP